VRARQSGSAQAADTPVSAEDFQALLARLESINALLEQQGAAHQVHDADLRGRPAEIERKLAGG